MYKHQIDQWDTSGKGNMILEKGEKKGFVLILMQE